MPCSVVECYSSSTVSLLGVTFDCYDDYSVLPLLLSSFAALSGTLAFHLSFAALLHEALLALCRKALSGFRLNPKS